MTGLHKFTLQTACLSFSAYLYIGKGHAYDEVAGPVAAASESNGSRPRSLAEQLSDYEPRNGTRTDLKETHKEEDSWHADVAHPQDFFLEDGETSVRFHYYLWPSSSFLSLFEFFSQHWPTHYISSKCNRDEMQAIPINIWQPQLLIKAQLIDRYW